MPTSTSRTTAAFATTRHATAQDAFQEPSLRPDSHMVPGTPTRLRHSSAKNGGLKIIARNRMSALQVLPGMPASRSSCVGLKGRASSQRSIDYHIRSGLPKAIPEGNRHPKRATSPLKGTVFDHSLRVSWYLDAFRGIFDAVFRGQFGQTAREPKLGNSSGDRPGHRAAAERV